MSADLLKFVSAMREAEKSGNNHAAIALAVTLPDICASVDDPGSGKSSARYIRWWDEFARPYFDEMIPPDDVDGSVLPGPDAWGLRNAYLHAGQDEFKSGDARRRIRFCHSQPGGMGYDTGRHNIFLPVDYFVEAVASGVELWLRQRQGSRRAAPIEGLIEILAPDDFYDIFIDAFTE